MLDPRNLIDLMQYLIHFATDLDYAGLLDYDAWDYKMRLRATVRAYAVRLAYALYWKG